MEVSQTWISDKMMYSEKICFTLYVKMYVFIYVCLRCLTEDFSQCYTIGKWLGRGGYASVYAAVRTSDGEKVNISTLTAEYHTRIVEHYILLQVTEKLQHITRK